MIQCNNSNIELLKISYVGNRISGEKVKLTNEALRCDDLTKNLLGRYLLSSIEYHQLYKFTHSEGVAHNKVYAFASEIFEEESSFEQIADDLSYMLYDKANDKSILGGYLFIVYFKNCMVDEIKTDALGFFKAETKDIFLKLNSEGSEISLSSEQGFALNKMDKGCIIFNVEKEDGYRLAVVNKSHSKANIKYWNEDFLHCVPVSSDYLSTQAVLKAIGQFIKEQEGSQFTKAFLINKSLQEAQKDTFDVNEIMSTVTTDETGKKRIQDLYSTYTGDNDPMPDFVRPDSLALKKLRLKSVLKLDDNFEIIFHGGDNRIEKGVDETTGMYYIKLLYEHDS